MIIVGNFKDIMDREYRVEINNPNSAESNIIIGEHYGGVENDIMYFSDEPVELKMEFDDLFQVIGKQSCKIDLQTREYIGNLLFADNDRSVTVKVTEIPSGRILFDGYVDPGTFNQPFTSPYDEFTINCSDKLSTLKYHKYKNCKPGTYNGLKSMSDKITFKQLVIDALSPILGNGSIYYDMSKGLESGSTSALTSVFQDITVVESIFFGDDFDECWTEDVVLEEVLRYLNLHIIQVGSDFYIFDWNSITGSNIQFSNIASGQTSTYSGKTVQINAETNAGNGTNVTIGDVYNQISVTDDTNQEDEVISNPLDTDNLTSVFSNKQKFMTEYYCHGEGVTAYDAFGNIIRGQATDYDNAYRDDWYIQWLENENWLLHGHSGEMRELYEKDNKGTYINQWKVSKYLRDYRLEPAIIALGKAEYEAGRVTDDSPVTKVSMSNYLVISLNGNEDRTLSGARPSPTEIENASPVVEFLGGNVGSVYSPNDDETTNYLVFQGTFQFVPIQKQSGPFSECYSRWGTYVAPLMRYGWHHTVPSDENEDGRYYTRKWYKIQYPNDDSKNAQTEDTGFMPPTSVSANQFLEYNYSESWEWNDTISNLDILECEMIIGNKRLIQLDTASGATYEWVTLGEEPSFNYEGSPYTVTTFKLGINPKLDDFIIGQDYKIRSNTNFEYNIEVEGTAIPIKKSDALSGSVIFRILGPVNTTWDVVTRRHPTFFRHTKWTTESYFVLPQAESLVIKDFKCSLVSDNAGVNVKYKTTNRDIIYVSNESDRYINKRDDITFRIITQPTTQEALDIGCSTQINYNAALQTSDGLYVSSIYNATTQETEKAEKHYVSDYYTKYCEPKVGLETELWDDRWSFFDIYNYNQLNRTFLTTGFKRTLVDAKVELKLREVSFND